tara:strand:- start:2703 stop:4253 length:1551 start_codon:yes stop_codon:yes gene_type:complete
LREKIVIFNVENTLIKGNSLIIAAWCANKSYQFFFKLIYFFPIFLIFKIGILNPKEFKEKFLKIFDICKMFNDNSENHFNKLILSKLRNEAIAKLNYHKKKGHKIYLCSAAPEILLKHLAKTLEVKIISTRLVFIDKKWLPHIDGLNCSGQEKLNQIIKNISPINKIDLEVYGDSLGDKEILEAADHPHFRNFETRDVPYPLISIKSVLIIFIILIFIYYLLNNLLLGNQFYLIIKQSANIIFFGLCIIFLSYILRFLRWRFLLHSLGLRPPILEDFRIWMGSYAFTMTPGKTGEAIRCLILKKQYKLSPLYTFSALIFERFTDLLSVLVIIFFNIRKIMQLELFKNLNITSYKLFYLLIIFFLFGKFLNNFFKNPPNFINILINKNLKIKGNLIYSIKKLFKVKIIIVSSIIAILSWSLEGLSFFILLNDLGAKIDPAIAIFTHSTSGLIGALTFIPGGIGTTEASTIGLLTLHDIPIDISTSSTLLIRIMTLWFATILGIFCLIIPKFNNEKKN